MIDTHTHLDFKEFDEDKEEVIKRAYEAGIEKIINVGCSPEHSQGAVDLAQNYDQIYAAVGVHPHDANKINDEILDDLKKLAQNKKVVAIGEIGLDYYRIDADLTQIATRIHADPKEVQKLAFVKQLNLAKELKLPVIIHCRYAYEDMLEMINSFSEGKSVWGVTHCFSGSRKFAKQFLNLGLYLSFTGAITYTKNPDAEIFQVIKEVPLDKIMIETDCPYLAPTPHRGERNEPAYVKFVAEKIAEIRKITFEEVERVTTENAERLFRI